MARMHVLDAIGVHSPRRPSATRRRGRCSAWRAPPASRATACWSVSARAARFRSQRSSTAASSTAASSTRCTPSGSSIPTGRRSPPARDCRTRRSERAGARRGWAAAAETTLRLAAALNDDESLFSDGFHTSALFGTFGAAAGVSKLLGLDRARPRPRSRSASASRPAPPRGGMHRPGRNKPLQPGWAAHGGTVAALLARAGQGAHSTRSTGRAASTRRTPGGRVGPQRVLDGLGTEWKCFATSFKVYPAGGMIQAADDCTLELVREHGIEPSEVESVEVTVPAQFARVLLLRCSSEKRRPAGRHDAVVAGNVVMILSWS